MGKNIPEIVKNASLAWANTADMLGVKITAPFSVLIGSENIQCIAFVHDFGSPKGTIVGVLHPETSATDNGLREYAKQKGIFCSFVNPLGWVKYSEYNQDAFKEVLEDWGYYGEQDKCPAWFKGCKFGKALP